MRKELAGKPIDVITVGDYQPSEAKYKLIRKCLEVILDFGFPFHGIEKSTIIIRDLDLLKKINREACGVGPWGSCVSFSFSTTDDRKAKIFEPHAPLPSERLKAMSKITSEGILSGATYMPVLPFITDDDKSLEATIKKVKEYGGKYILFGGLTFNPPFQKRYYKVLEKYFPKTITKYKKLYASAGRWGIGSTASSYFAELNKKIDQLCQKYRLFNYIPRWIPKYKIINNYKVAEKLYVKGKDLFSSGASFYQVAAYNKAGQSIDNLKDDIKEVYNKEGLAGVKKIKGVGEKLSCEIEKIIRKAYSPDFHRGTASSSDSHRRK